MPGDPVAGSDSENARTAPGTPTTPTLAGSSTRVAGDGHVTAWVQLAWTNPSTNFSQARVRYRATGSTPWLTAAVDTTPGVTLATIEGLLPATPYDYSIQAVNAPGTLTADSATLANQLSPTDSSVPSAPNGMFAVQSGAKVVEIGVGFTAPADFGMIFLYRHTTNNFNAPAALINSGKKNIFHDEAVSYGTTYYYWAKVGDTSNNLSPVFPAPTAGTSITVVQIQSPDVGDNQIPTPKIPDGNITTPKLPPQAVTSSVFDTDSAGQTTTSTTFVNYTNNALTLNVSSAASVILVMLTADMRITQNGAVDGFAAGTMGLKIAGVESIAQEGWMWLPPGTPGMFPITVTLLDGPGRLGNTTYQCMFRAAVSGTTVDIFTPILQVTELKR